MITFIKDIITLRSLDRFLRTNKFADIWKERDGMLSMMRFLNSMIVMLIMFVWTFVSLYCKFLAPMPESVVLLIVAALTGKVAQRFLEGKEDKNVEPPSQPPV